MSLYKKSIGGFFGLETVSEKSEDEYHKNLYRFNIARSALEVLIRTKNIKKIHLPAYSCNVILESIKNCKIDYSFYEITNDLEIKEKVQIQEKEYLLYINYFGIKSYYINELSKNQKRLIIDNSQAFFEKPIYSVDSFYSVRKFFGTPDGAYLSTDIKIDINIYKKANSEERISHLLLRKEKGPEQAYPFFVENEEKLNNLPIQRMSNYTIYILKHINYKEIIKKRRRNFEKLHSELKAINMLNINYTNYTVPMCYPLYIDNALVLRKKLIDNKVFIPKYWPNIESYFEEFEITKKLTENILALPIDQRYEEKDMKIILKLLKQF